MINIWYRLVPDFLGETTVFYPVKQRDGAPIIGVPVCPTVKQAVQAIPTFTNGGLYSASKFWVYRICGKAYACSGVHDFARTKEHRFIDPIKGTFVAIIYISQLDCLSCGCADTIDCDTCIARFIVPKKYMNNMEIVYPYRTPPQALTAFDSPHRKR